LQFSFVSLAGSSHDVGNADVLGFAQELVTNTSGLSLMTTPQCQRLSILLEMFDANQLPSQRTSW
jgi:hypothetical protein